jgi:hypothetical protein
MGMEYTLRLEGAEPEAVTALLRRRWGAHERPGSPGAFDVPAGGQAGGTPHATVQVDRDWVYFCDHGGVGEQILGRVVAWLAREFGSVTVAELE